MQNSLTSFSGNVKESVFSVVPLVIVIILFIIVGRFGVPKVLGVRSEVVSAQKTEQALTQKLNLLQSLAPGVATETDMVSSALPDTNPSLEVMAQLKNLALSNGVVLSALKSTGGSADSSGLDIVTTTFTLEGARQQIFSFLTQVDNIAPITKVKKISLTGIAVAGVSADISVTSYYAAYPETLPAVTDPVTDLTAGEKQILTNISGLIQPSFAEITPSQTDINPIPFGQ